MTTMRLQGDLTEYRGKTPETIARRLYGKTARVFPSRDPNSPTWGWTVAPGKTLCPLCATILGSKPVVCHLYPQDETPKEAGQ